MVRHRKAGVRALILLTDAHGAFGGIAQYNRYLIEALSGFDFIEKIQVLPRIAPKYEFVAPPKVTYDFAAAKGSVGFLERCAAAGLRGGYDLVFCGHINLLPAAALVSHLRRVPHLLSIHGIDAWSPPTRALARKLASHVDMVMAVSQLTLERFRGWSGIDARSTTLLPNAIKAGHYGVGAKNTELARKLGIEDKKVIMTFGRMSADERYKGFDEIIDIMPQLSRQEPAIVYLAAGEGDDRPRLEAKARTLGVGDRVVFTGLIPEEQKADYYRLADAYVMPSRGEGFGIVVLEALASGLPVVASAVDGTREAVRDGALGRVIDPADPQALREAIVEALQKPKAVPAGLEYFSFERFAARLHDIVEPIIER